MNRLNRLFERVMSESSYDVKCSCGASFNTNIWSLKKTKRVTKGKCPQCGATGDNLKYGKKHKESIDKQPISPQDPATVRMLNAQPLYYYASDDALSAGQTVQVDKYLSYSLEYARGLQSKYLYAVETPTDFVYTKASNDQTDYCIISKSPVKVKQVL